MPFRKDFSHGCGGCGHFFLKGVCITGAFRLDEQNERANGLLDMVGQRMGKEQDVSRKELGLKLVGTGSEQDLPVFCQEISYLFFEAVRAIFAQP